MYEIVKGVIDSKDFELESMLKKIDTIWVKGEITDEQRDSLLEYARANCIPENSYAGFQQRLDDLYAEHQKILSNFSELSQSVKMVIEAIKKLTDFPTLPEPEEPEEIETEWPEYKNPTGAHDAYYNGAKVTFNGKHYICVAPEGTAVVWSPEVFPTYWQVQE